MNYLGMCVPLVMLMIAVGLWVKHPEVSLDVKIVATIMWILFQVIAIVVLYPRNHHNEDK